MIFDPRFGYTANGDTAKELIEVAAMERKLNPLGWPFIHIRGHLLGRALVIRDQFLSKFCRRRSRHN